MAYVTVSAEISMTDLDDDDLVREAHAKALRLNADIVAQAEAFYAAKAVPAGASMV